MFYNYLFKIIITGDINCGKTSICNRHKDDKFYYNTESTIGADYFSFLINYENKKIKLQTWDIAGNTTYREIISSYIRDMDLAVVCFSLNSPASYNSVKPWINKITSQNNNKDIPIILVGTKCDLPLHYNINKFDILQLCNQIPNIVKYLETSSKNNINIQELFLDICDITYKYKKENNKLDNNMLSINIDLENSTKVNIFENFCCKIL